MKNSTLFLKRTMLPVSLSFWLLFFFASLASFAQSNQTSMLGNKNSSSTAISQNSPSGNHYTTFDEGDCGHETPSNDFENGLGNLHILEFANDFTVNANEVFAIDSINFTLFVNPGLTINSADLRFYEDSGSGPGEEITDAAVTGLTPATDEYIGEAFNFDARSVTFEFEDPVTLAGSSSEVTYWVSIILDDYSGENSYMEVTTILNTDNTIYYFDDDDEEWISSLEDPTFEAAYNGVMAIYGECSDLEGCTGEPEAGQIAGDDSIEVCEGGGFTLTVSGSTAATDLLYQWQSSPVGEEDWTDIEDANELTLQFENITEDTDFRFRIECENSGEFAFTDAVTVNVIPAEECYCIPEGTNSGRYINNFSTTGAIDNVSNTSSGFSPGGYGDFTNMTISQENTQDVSFEVDIVGGTAGFRIWIDWNKDGNFTSDEVVYQSSGYSASHAGSFTVPEDVAAGETRMRIVSHWLSTSGDIDPCETGFTYGEFEDYTFEVIELEDCEGMPTAGTVDEDELEVCAGMPFTVSVSDADGAANNLYRRWQSSPAGEDDWTDIDGSGASTFVVENGVNEPTDFRYVLTCNEEDTDISDIIQTTLKPAIECYCIPLNTGSTTSYITKVETVGASGTDLNKSSEFSEDGYADYTETDTLVAFPGDVIDLTTTYQGGTSYVEVWIDWDIDGNFDGPDDHVISSGSYVSSPHTGTFEIPLDITDGLITRLRVRAQYLGGSPGPCEETGYGETEDYTIEILPLEDCEEPVSAGEVVDSELEVCAGIDFNIAVTGGPDPANNLIRQWQSSPAGEDDWTDIEGAHANSYIVTDGVDEPTDFRYKVACNDGDPDYSDIIEVTLKPAIECYCTPEGTSSSYFINNFSTSGGEENIENLNSGFSPGGYGDFTETHIVSQAHTLSVDFEAEYTGGTFGTKIWVDWNQDGLFDDDEIVYQTSSYSSSESGSFEVPESAELGETRMRIGIAWSPSTGPNDPCESGSREFEDYTFEVLALDDCEGTPTAGTVDPEMSVCAGVAFTLSAEGATGAANGLDRIWQSSPAGEEDWTDLEGLNSPNSILEEGITEPTDFRYSVNCTLSDESDISEVMEVTLNPANECYCIPEGTNSNRYINNFSTTGAIDNISNLNSGFSPGGYGDFTDMIISQENTGEVSFSVDIQGGTAGFRIWVDWNNDGNFSSDEVVYQSSGYSGSHSGSFTVPENADSGQTRMRIVSHWLSTTGDIDPCETGFTYGEFEDYTFEVIELEDCEGMPTAGTPDEYEIEVCAGSPFTLSVSDATGAANNLYRRWQSSPAGEEDWTDMDGASSPSHVVSEGVMEPTDFRYVLTCNEEDTDISDVIEVTLKPALECYCIPENTSSSSQHIINVSTEGALQDIDNDTGFSDNGYEDYSESHEIIVYPGQEFDYSVSGSSSSMNYGVWLDMNQNGIFEEPSEKIGGSGSYISAPFTGSFEVPTDMDEGAYRLRVRANWLGGTLGPCEDNNNGETEDYTLLVIYPDCFPPIDIEINYITDVSAQVTWEASDEDSWELIYGEQGFDPEEEGTTIQVDGTPLADLTDLDDDTTYQVYIKTICGEEESLLIGPRTFTTNITPPENTRLCDAIPLEPNSGCIGGPYTNVAAFEETGEPIGSCLNDYRGENTVWFTFVASGTGEAVITTDFNSTDILTEIVVFEAPTDCEDMSTLGEEVGCANASEEGVLEVEGLTPGETYYVKIGGFNNQEGVFCVEVQLEDVPICFAPTEIEIGEITEDTVDVSWTAGGDETQWEVIYGEEGFSPDTEGDSEIVDTTEVTLTDLTPETDYEVYVRAICTNLNSDLAGPEPFTTDEMSVDSHIFADFTFYPNPVKGQLTLKAGSQIETVEVYNLLGQNVISEKPNSLEAQINTENLQSGVYLMNVTLNGNQKTFRVVKK